MVAGSRALASLVLALSLAAGGAAAQAEARAGSVIAKTEAGLAAENRAALVVTSSVKVASVELNRAEVGKVTFSSDELLPGTYLVVVSAPGYATLEYQVELAERTRTSLHFVLARATGLLSLSVEPADAELLVDGLPVSGTELELATGRHELLARRFGYEEKRVSVLVAEQETKGVQIALPVAAFALEGPRASRSSFNPANAGPSGSTTIRFSVTGPASARLEIRDAAGSLVAEREYPAISTWGQSYDWAGRGPDGAPLPDGAYEARVEASPAEAQADGAGPLASTAQVRIDSSIVAQAAGSVAAMPGSLLFADPRSPRAGGASAELAWLFPSAGLSGSVLGLGASASLGGRFLVGFGAAAEMSEAPEADLGLSLLASIARGKVLALSAFARGSWSSAAEPLLPGSSTGAELSLPASLSLGPFSLGLSPGVIVDLSSSGPSASPLARAGAWLAGPAYRAGVSASLALGGADGFLSPSWPARICAEARFLLPPSPLAASAYALASLEPGAAPSFAFGLGLGFVL